MRRLLAVIFIVAIANSVFAGTAPQDSLYMILEEGGAMRGWMSVRTEPAGDDVRYISNGVINGTEKVHWEAVISKDLTMPKSAFFRGRMQGSKIIFDIKYNAGESPDVSINFDGNQYPGPDDKMPKRFILIPQLMPTGLAILSEYLSGKDPEDYSGKFPASNMLGKMSLIIEGVGKNEIELGGSKIKVRSFDFALSSKDMKKDITGRLDQFEDGSFCGVKMDENTSAYVVSAPAGGAEEAVNEIEFTLETSSADTLSAKMVPPKDASFENPAPLLVICNGPESMAENSFNFSEYLASELSDRGIASVFYSSREDSVTMQTVIDDAVLACRESNGAPGTQPGKVMLFGSGLGTMALAEIAQNVTSDSLNVTGLVSVGGVCSSGTAFHAEIPQNEEAFWFDSFLSYEPAIADYANPVLLLHGANDQEVPSSQSINLKSDLSDSGNIKVLCNVINGTNHFLQKSDSGNVDEYDSLPPECVRGVVDRIAKFILDYNK